MLGVIEWGWATLSSGAAAMARVPEHVKMPAAANKEEEEEEEENVKADNVTSSPRIGKVFQTVFVCGLLCHFLKCSKNLGKQVG